MFTLSHLTNIQNLNLFGSQITDKGLTRLSLYLTTLKNLQIGYCQVTDAGLRALSQLSSLERVLFNHCKKITVRGQHVLRKVTCSKKLHVYLSIKLLDEGMLIFNDDELE